MKSFLNVVVPFLAVTAAVLGLVAPRSVITSFVLVLGGLVAFLGFISNLATLRALLHDRRILRERAAEEKAAADAAEKAAADARQAAMIAEAVRDAMVSAGYTQPPAPITGTNPPATPPTP